MDGRTERPIRFQQLIFARCQASARSSDCAIHPNFNTPNWNPFNFNSNPLDGCSRTHESFCLHNPNDHNSNNDGPQDCGHDHSGDHFGSADPSADHASSHNPNNNQNVARLSFGAADDAPKPPSSCDHINDGHPNEAGRSNTR